MSELLAAVDPNVPTGIIWKGKELIARKLDLARQAKYSQWYYKRVKARLKMEAEDEGWTEEELGKALDAARDKLDSGEFGMQNPLVMASTKSVEGASQMMALSLGIEPDEVTVLLTAHKTELTAAMKDLEVLCFQKKTD